MHTRVLHFRVKFNDSDVPVFRLRSELVIGTDRLRPRVKVQQTFRA